MNRRQWKARNFRERTTGFENICPRGMGMARDKSRRKYKEGGCLFCNALPGRPTSRPKKEIVYHAIHAVKGMLNEARVPLGHDFQVELSHHYGIDRFREIGSTIITCFNKEYAKKVIVALPGQWNPEHYHKKKDETFQILKGILEVEINGRKKILEPGDSLWIPRGVLHGFGSGQGAVFEEISTTDYNDDSFYTDRSIAAMNREDRKTKLLNWGQHQLDAFEEDELRAI